jgi:hypothetical protein
MPVNYSPFAGNIGIEGISWRKNEVNLPAETTVLPSGDLVGQAALDTLYGSRLEEQLRAFVKPNLAARDLLLPGVLNARLYKARLKLRSEARRRGSRTMARAADLLEEDEEMKHLLALYRGLLQKG